MISTSCRCGACRIVIRATPRLRMYCHCTICQRFNRAPKADIVALRRRDVVLEPESPVNFQRYKRWMAVDRGACRECGQPVIEYLDLPLLPALAMVPSALLEESSLPAPSLHLFYEHRVADVQDDLPRHEGFLASQLAASKLILGDLRRDRR